MQASADATWTSESEDSEEGEHEEAASELRASSEREELNAELLAAVASDDEARVLACLARGADVWRAT